MTMKAVFCLLCFALIMAVPAKSAEWDGVGGIAFKQIVALDLEFTDNAFELDEDDKDRLKHPEQEDVDSGRVFGMDAVEDLIVSPRLGLSADMGSPFRGRLSLSSWLKYHMFCENPEKTYPEISISLDHDVGDSGRISWSWTGLDNYFKSNELVSVNDENGNGNISGGERVYAPARYNEYETALTYRLQLYKNKQGLLSKVDVEPEIGLSERRYGDVFSNRDRMVLFAGTELTFTWLQDMEVALAYRYDDIESPNGEERVLYDETVVDRDVNGDGSIAGNAALLTRVDRSCRRHELGFQPQWSLNKNLKVFAGYKWRKTEYLSDNILDENHYGKTKIRQKVSAGMSWAFTPRWSAELSGSHIDEDAEKNDGYTENTLGFQVRYRFP